MPQVTLQVLLFFSIIKGRELTDITDSDLILSIVAAVLNSVIQVIKMKMERTAANETFVQYSLNCIIARFVVDYISHDRVFEQ